jgi:ferric-dicitrate binding protein FerR (iron transport regulator)
MTDRIDWDRLARYASGEAEAGERADVERSAAEDPVIRAAIDSVRRGWDASAAASAWDVDGAWARLQPRLRDAPVLPLSVATARRQGWWRVSRVVPLAAAAVLVIAVALRIGPGGSDAGAPVTALSLGSVLRTGVGEQRTVDLPDGSRVQLGAASTLTLGEEFGIATREVYLEGQAFIRVVHDTVRPFVVNAGGTRTVDLGTAFEVRAYPNEGVRVVVTEGSVEVRREDGTALPAAVLEAGDFAQLFEGADAVIRRQVDVERLVGWTRGDLTFDDAALSDVAAELERWFDIEVAVDGEAIEALHLTAQLRIGESLEEILRVVELALPGVRAEREGRTITFRAGAPAVPPVRRAALRAEVGA